MPKKIFCISTLLLISGLATAAVPSDVRAVDNAWELLQEQAKSEESVAALSEIVWQSCLMIARETNSVSAMRIDSDEFRDFVHNSVNQIPSAQFAEDRVLGLLQQVTSRNVANMILGRWLGAAGAPFLPASGGVIGNVVERARDAVSGSGRSSSGPPPISEQVRVIPSEGGLTVTDSGATLLADIGGAGSGNGVIDAGEWVRLGIEVSNSSSDPWFSTSAWPRSGSDCVWVAESDEFVLNEMAPNGGSSAVSAWAYVSRECGASASIIVGARDSIQGGGREQRIRIVLSPRSGGQLRTANVRLDADEPGSSDGSDTTVVSAGNSYEFSTGFRVPSRMSTGRSAYEIQPSMSTLIESQDYTLGDLIAKGSGRFNPSDDIDFRTVSNSRYETAIEAIAATDGAPSRWVTYDEAIMWVAMDSEFNAIHSYEVEVAGSGQAASNGTASESAPTTRVPASVVGRLIRENVHLEPRRVSTVASGAIEASDGYEIVIDAAAIMEEYNAYGAPAAASGGSGRAGPATTTRAVESVVPYRYLNYVPIPISPPPEPITGCMDARADNFLADANVDDGSCVLPSGCTDRRATNYISRAVVDDGSCVLPTGCTDRRATNYMIGAVVDDGSCVLPSGCTDTRATNYSRSAVEDDGSCRLPTGCTDSRATNYSSHFIVDDGSCVIPSGCTNRRSPNYDRDAVEDDGSCEAILTKWRLDFAGGFNIYGPGSDPNWNNTAGARMFSNQASITYGVRSRVGVEFVRSGEESDMELGSENNTWVFNSLGLRLGWAFSFGSKAELEVTGLLGSSVAQLNGNPRGVFVVGARGHLGYRINDWFGAFLEAGVDQSLQGGQFPTDLSGSRNYGSLGISFHY